jgi:hypothetical protein
MNRAMRRAIGNANLGELLESSKGITGRSLSLDDLSFSGPGALVSVAAIYP